MTPSRSSWLFLFILTGWPVCQLLGDVPAVDPRPPSPSGLADLRQHPATWPVQLKLKADVTLVILRNGAKAGSLIAPADSMVQLLGVNETTVQVGVGAAQAAVNPDETDLWDRLAHSPPVAASSASASPAPSASSALPPATANFSTANPPTSPDAAPSPLPTLTDDKPLVFDWEAEPSTGFAKAAFHFWSPAYGQALQGLIVMVPGSDGDGRGLVNDGAWQALARKYRLALIGCFLQGRDYMECSQGSGEALRQAVRIFATQSGHPEVSTVPLLLWGISAGGEFNYNYIVWKPDNVMAFVVNKGGYYNDERVSGRGRSIPGLFFLGQSDADYRVKAITQIWTQGRQAGALWALAPQPNSGHEFSKTDPVARVFFEAVLKSRLPDASSSSDPAPMKDMQENQGWLGNLDTHEIHDEATDPQPDLKAAWLPEPSTAAAWKTFVSGG